MHRRQLIALPLTLLILWGIAFGQHPTRDQGKFIEYHNAFYDSIKASLATPKKTTPDTVFKLDATGYAFPQSVDAFTKSWFNPPISQGRTGTCWDFSTTSMLESDIYRTTGRKVKLSEMHTVYWEYVEKARRFVQERGDSFFGEGSEADAVTRIWKKYGVVPEDAYPGKPADQPFHDHQKMFAEMKSYLQSVEETNNWNEQAVLSTIRAILDHYMGTPPTTVTVGRKTYTPKEYLHDYLKLNPDDYVSILSLEEKPYYQKVEYTVPDNWWHSKEYYNIPLDEFMSVIHRAIRQGYTLSIGGDVSEAGYLPDQDVAIIPSFDIPPEYINEDARQFRFSNGTTTDDHGIHLVGYLEKNGHDWYLIKDSGSGSHNGKNVGFYFYRDDYIKLKIMDFMVHKDAVKDILKKF